MNIGSLLRRFGFYTLDLLRGGACIACLKDIKSKYANENYSDCEQLNDILRYAVKNVPFYNSITIPTLSNFPVMRKEVYKREGANCLSKQFKNFDILHKTQTSGSTGEPMVVYQDAKKRNRVKMDLINAHTCIGWNLGDKYVFIRNWVSNYEQSKIKQIMQNFLPVSITTFDNAHKKKLLDYLCNHKKMIIFGYSSAVIDFMNYCIKNNVDTSKLKIKLIVCDSDELTEKNKKKLSRVFSCPVINRYDNEECGLIAISDEISNTFKVNYPSLHIELLKLDSDEAAFPGEIGRVVITDLYNKAMPLIRYDTGDLACSSDENGKIQKLDYLAGRQHGNLTNTDNRLISSVALSGALEPFSNIQKYQIIQSDGYKYTLKYVGSISETEMEELKHRLKACFGSSATLEFENFDKLSPSKTGKFQTTINLCSL